MSNVKPLPCPFCGGVATILKTYGDERDGYADKVICACNKCGCSITVSGDTSKGGYADNRGVEARAILSWNKRTTPTSPQAAQPAAYQFQDRDGKWCGFMNDQHYQSTVANGTWPIRALYTHADAGEVERLRAIIRMHEQTVLEQSNHLARMRAQLAERDELLTQVRRYFPQSDQANERLLLKKIDAVLSTIAKLEADQEVK